VSNASPALPCRDGQSFGEPDAEGVLVHVRDGSAVWIRPAHEGDEPQLWRFLDGLCLEARHLRFFSGAVDIAKAAHAAAQEGPDRFGLLALDETAAILGHAAYVQLDPARAEVAVEVADAFHGRGLATILIEQLAEAAERAGITHFVADVLSENHAMLDVFREGFDARVVHAAGPQERVEFLTSGWRLARARFCAGA
jgi:GNAT superfamily N-acetyltransferase